MEGTMGAGAPEAEQGLGWGVGWQSVGDAGLGPVPQFLSQPSSRTTTLTSPPPPTKHTKICPHQPSAPALAAHLVVPASQCSCSE